MTLGMVWELRCKLTYTLITQHHAYSHENNNPCLNPHSLILKRLNASFNAAAYIDCTICHRVIYFIVKYRIGIYHIYFIIDNINISARSWSAAVKWYQNAVDVVDEDDEPENSLQTDPIYKLLARQAELYLSGGFGLEKDPSYSGELYSKAGDEAMAAMNGKLANKFYSLAEEAWAEVPEEE